ncbi:uncharacterized protein LOC141651458 [Silene latifolia]|uniref:uncharacterized protein LOC141651458 n=1 Tax=Silene latifolia TaxID=37657 RepID=UPI003D782E6E
MSKILCDRMKPLLPNLVGLEQGAFVKGRSIFENIMLTQSLIKGYGQQGVSPRCLMKVDIKKAFDSLQWRFLGQMLAIYYFPPQFQKWIMECVTSTWFSLKINGSITGFFKGESGLREGDPLSPFLFVMGMEYLSRILRGIHKQHQVSYHPKCGRIGLNHLIFADDLMIFFRGDTSSVRAVTKSLGRFAQLSGLQANPEKTSIYMRGIREDIQREILRAIGYTEGFFRFRYLGVPLNEGKLNKTMFADLLKKVQQTMHHWSTHHISYAGKINLINTEFPMEFRGGTQETDIESWASSCMPLREGGFNIKEILAWNKCILCKWIWEIERHSASSWVVWNYTYNIKRDEFWTMDVKPYHSESWRSILKVRDELLERTGNAANAKALLQSCIRQKGVKVRWVNAVWNRAVLPKHRFIVTLALQSRLATIDQLSHRGMYLINRCILCKAALETHQHLFFQCPYAATAWQSLLLWMKITCRTMNLRKEINWIAGKHVRRHWKARWFMSCLTAMVYSLWEERNLRIFQGIEHDIPYIIRRVQYLVSVRLIHVTHSSHKDKIVALLNV